MTQKRKIHFHQGNPIERIVHDIAPVQNPEHKYKFHGFIKYQDCARLVGADSPDALNWFIVNREGPI